MLITGRQLEHWHTGAMTRRAIDARCARAGRRSPIVSRGTIAQARHQARATWCGSSTRRGTIELAARQDDAMPDGVVFIPFAFVEAAANLLTNPALDPFGKIPEFKYCAAKVEAVASRRGWRRSKASPPSLDAALARSGFHATP